MKWNVITAIFFLALGIGVTVGAVRLSQIGGPSYDPSRASDLIELRKLVYSLTPAVERLHELDDSSQSLPEGLHDLVGLPEHFLDTYPLLDLSNHKDSFSLYYKLGWDPSLRYDSIERRWTYDPGDGSEETLINP